MNQAQTEAEAQAQALDAPLTVVSCDGHAGPRLEEDLRAYCPAKYLPDFNVYVAERQKALENGISRSLFVEGGETDPGAARMMTMFANMMKTAGHYDMAARLKDMDADGVTAEVIFPSSHNQQSEPFIHSDLFLDPTKGDADLFKVGMHIYASWLADACKAAPARLIGLVTPPLWDIEASVAEVEWAHSQGLKGVFLLMGRRGILRYDSPEWEPFWSVCEDLGMTLNCHSGAPLEGEVHGAHTFSMHEVETGGWPARRAAHQMIFSGVFERHPRLKLVFTEQNFDWWTQSIREFDSSFHTHHFQLKSILRRKPSEYMASNVHIGASFLAPFEARDAVDNGYVDNVMWGRDYGHIEGTFQPTDTDDVATNPSRMSMRWAFADIAAGPIRKMVSENALSFFDLDAVELARVAKSIGAPSLNELTTAIQAIPDNGGALAFRTIGAWG